MTKQDLIMMLRYDLRGQRKLNSQLNPYGAKGYLFIKLNDWCFYVDGDVKFEFDKYALFVKHQGIPIASLAYDCIVAVGYTFPFAEDVKRAVDILHNGGKLNEVFNEWMDLP